MPIRVVDPEPTSPNARPKNLRTLEVRHVEIIKLSNFNQLAHTFQAQLFMSLAFRGGALPSEADGLNAGGDAFPTVNGWPTFRPPVGWFLKQFEPSNVPAGLSARLLDSLIKQDGDDLLLNMRWEGTFYEPFELNDFPFDSQRLTISMALNCRTTGPMPVEMVVPAGCGNSLDFGGYTEGHGWRVIPCPDGKPLRFRTTNVGGDPSRLFPTLNISVLVKRRSTYFVVNAIVPFMLFTVLSLSQFCVTASSEGSLNHRAQLTLMLVLTVAAYKMSVGGKLPAITYLTILDKYMLPCTPSPPFQC